MNPLISHIEFLLHDHNCVIIPGFGGFVVNNVPPQRDGFATILAPACELVFNRDLTHNDGLLPQSYMKNGGISFEAATQKVEQDVKDLKRQLFEQRHLDMGKLGSFAMHDDKRFIYTPGAFVRPALFGLTSAALKPVIQIQPAMVADRNSDNKRKWRRGTSISAAAVAAVLLWMFILPVSDNTIGRQSARMISETGWFTPKTSSTANSTVSIDEVMNMAVNMEEKSITGNSMLESAPDISLEDVPHNSPKYYIVMGVFSTIESARKNAQQLQEEGFNQTQWLERTERFDVYAASFTDKNAAEVYLKEVHKKYPGHIDAWILKR